MRHGEGVMNYADGSIYKGSWKNDQREGQGSFKWGNEGAQYDG